MYSLMTTFAKYNSLLACQLIAPLLHPDSLSVDVRLAPLLHGPPGSGRATAAAAAAAALGLNFMSVNCYEIKVTMQYISPVSRSIYKQVFCLVLPSDHRIFWEQFVPSTVLSVTDDECLHLNRLRN